MSTVILAPELDAITKGWEKHILNQRPPRTANDADDARNYIYASSRRACRRRMVLEATHPSYFPDFDVDAKARFIRGEQREIDLRQALERVGQLCMPSFTVEGQQERITIHDRKGRKVIVGKIDCKIKWESRVKWPTEFKSWSPFITDKIFEFADLMRSPWTKSGAYQLLSYLYKFEEPYGLLVLDRPGLPRLIKVSLEDNIEMMEEFLQDATIAVDHIEAETLPGFIDDPEECKRCPLLGSHCNPPMSYDGADVITDEETIAKVERLAELEKGIADAGLEEYENLDTWAKKRFRGVTMAIAGKCLVQGKWQRDTKYSLTDEAKKQIEAIKKPFAEKVEKGKFFLTISKVG